MSLAIKAGVARAGGPSAVFQGRRDLRGDPGFFGSIGKFFGGAAKTVGGLLPGPAGTILTAAGGLISGGSGTVIGRPVSVAAAQPIRRDASITSFTQEKFPGKIGPFDVDVFGFGQEGASISLFGPNGGQSTAIARGANGACASGFHLNKAAYTLKSGQRIEKGTVCVKNRRRNPLNDRAASNAIRRLEGARK
ncbi:hypothetical protein LCGC14_2252630, partial [marine sediment metagenome]